MIQRIRDEGILNDILVRLDIFQKTRDSSGVVDLIYQANKRGLSYDLDTLDDILALFHHLKSSAIAIYDDLYPPTSNESQHICRSRRQLIKRMGIRV